MFTFMKNLIKKIGSFLRRLTGKAFELLREKAELAVLVTATLKNIVESPLTGALVDLLKLPGDVDDKALLVLRRVLPAVAEKTAIAFSILESNNRNADAVSAIIWSLKETHPSMRGAFWLVFSAELNAALSDGELTLAEAAALAQMVYTEKKMRSN